MVFFSSVRTNSLVGKIEIAHTKQHYTRKDKENYIVASCVTQNIKAIGLIREGFLWKAGAPVVL